MQCNTKLCVNYLIQANGCCALFGDANEDCKDRKGTIIKSTKKAFKVPVKKKVVKKAKK